MAVAHKKNKSIIFVNGRGGAVATFCQPIFWLGLLLYNINNSRLDCIELYSWVRYVCMYYGNSANPQTYNIVYDKKW